MPAKLVGGVDIIYYNRSVGRWFDKAGLYGSLYRQELVNVYTMHKLCNYNIISENIGGH